MNAPLEMRATRFCVARQEDDCLVGTIGFFDVHDGKAEIAYDLHPDLWGKGIASAACGDVRVGDFSELQLTSIEACARVGNRASARVLEKCGFALEATVREIRYANGKPTDFWLTAGLPRKGKRAG